VHDIASVSGKDVEVVLEGEDTMIDKSYLDLGMIGADQKLEHNALVDLLFASGVSTAENVTDISGRGVGMDVVKQNIDSAGAKGRPFRPGKRIPGRTSGE
jgi:chemotaxis protein histidine kinase CheA